MRRILIIILLLPCCLLASPGVQAQDRNWWLQLQSFRGYNEANHLVGQISGRVSGLRIFRSLNNRYLVVSGRYTKGQAAQLRGQLITGGLIKDTSSITTGKHFREQVWPTANRPEAVETQQASTIRRGSEDAFAAQTALQWFGDYRGAIDGIFGAGTVAAIRNYQGRTETPVTGQLTRSQFNQLTASYEQELEYFGLQPVIRTAAGIAVDIPGNILRFSRVEEPFIYFEPVGNNRLQLFLISLTGSSATFESLFESMQLIDFIPDDGETQFSRDRFEIRAADDSISAYADVRLFDERIKGYLLIWDPVNETQMGRVTRAMSNSLQESSALTLTMPTVDGDRSSSPPLVRLDIPQPRFRQSGFFIDPQGIVVTSSVVADSCEQIFLFPNHEMMLGPVDRGADIALILPVDRQTPLSYARLRRGDPAKGEEITLSGFSFGGELGSPSQTPAIWNGNDPRNASMAHGLVAVDAYRGDIGGPVLDRSGLVVGALVADIEAGRRLPSGMHSVAKNKAISRLASQAGIDLDHADTAAELQFADLARDAKDITVLVECF
ncbi:MAG: serine protease [Rhodobacteraceae bacterium]|nr:serine protease [Paracoccaceae bacterium]MCY4326160.1 serine protease [Paracoccaceae bacterium]